jgi:poly(hydroxyalkanoate) granule-associated protein
MRNSISNDVDGKESVMITEKETREQKAGTEVQEDEKGTLELLQEGISKTSREIWLAGLGIFSTIDKEGTKLFNKFVDRGREMVERNGEPTIAAKKNGEPPPATYVSEKVDQFTHDVFSRLDHAAEYVRKTLFGPAEPSVKPSKDEVKILSEKVDKLTESVAVLVQKMDDTTKSGPRAKTSI